MNRRFALVASFAILVVMTAASLWGMHAIPANAGIAVHWDIEGHANGFAGKTQALWLLPGLGLALTALFAILPVIEPRRRNFQASRKLYAAAWIGTMILLAIIHIASMFGAMAPPPAGGTVLLVAVSFLVMLVGNFMGKTKSNFFLGVRTPWSLTSEYAWEKSNRLAGRLLFAAGLFTLPVLAAFDRRVGFVFFAVAVIAGALAGAVASYFYWRRDPARHASDGNFE